MKRLNSTFLTSLVAISASASDVSTSTTYSTVTPTTTLRRPYCKMTQDKDNGTTNGTTDTLAKNIKQANEILKTSNIVCFDVDSTIIQEEGIDELADFCGKGAEVAALTKEAMSGGMTFQEALKKRLDIIKPSQKQIREFIKNHPSTISPNVQELFRQLRANNTEIYLISGGFDCLIEPVATALQIPLSNLFANKLYFHFNGSYAGFDTQQVTSRSGGKGEAIKFIRQKFQQFNNNESAIITMIGDGATDLEASPPADYFIGYGGNVVREEVRHRANYYLTNFNQIQL
uniref:Phosphoserine phosphatase n=1 Tax=Corethrella appendiculata TaxID=1370023 RepID=U5ESX0_9DIPT